MSRQQKRNAKTPGRTPSRTRNTQTGSSSDDSADFDPVEVYCRIRPIDVEEKCVRMLDDTTVQVTSSDVQRAQSVMQYKFTKVFGEATSQKHLFDCAGAPLVDDLIRGKNGLLFTYGITSSGKTYTMTGTGQDQGILPRCLDMVFNSIKGVQATKYVFKPDRQNGFDIQSEADAMYERQQREVLPGRSKTREKMIDYSDRQKDPSIVLDIDKDGNYAVFVSFVEIYNNLIYDLLEELPYDPITGSKPPQGKILREDMSRVMFVHNVSESEVKSTEEAFDILVKGQKRRKVAHTVLNAESSRSHSVFTIRLVQAPLDGSRKEVLMDKDKVVVSQLSLVDLAGSERTNRTKSSGDRLKEAGQINQSLMVLRQCIDTLRDNQRSGGSKMVPYRDSKVTHLFKNYFEGQGKVRMIVCVNPKAAEYDETLHVMRFSEATQEVQVQRAQEKPKFTEMRTRRRLATPSASEMTPTPAKKRSTDRLPVAPVPMDEIYTLPAFPHLSPPMDETDTDLDTVKDYLQNLAKLKQKHVDTVHRKQDAFRHLLMNITRENERLKKNVDEGFKERDLLIKERDSLIVDLHQDADRDKQRLQVKEKEIRVLREKLAFSQHKCQELESEVNNKDWELHKNDYDREKMRARYEQQVAQAEAEYEAQLEEERKRIKQQAQENLTVKERKLQLLRNIMDQSDAESLAGDVAQSTTSSQQQRRPRAPTTVAGPSYATPTTSSRGKNMERFTKGSAAKPTSRPVTRQRARSPPPTSLRPNPVRNHRRSKSAGDKWLDHKPEAIQPLDTVLQPKMKKKKSVGKLEVKDTNKASRYVLTTQDSDKKGHLETKLVKGEVRPSACGGSSVVFTEVETLKQTSPGDRDSPIGLIKLRQGNTCRRDGQTTMVNGRTPKRDVTLPWKGMESTNASNSSTAGQENRLTESPSTPSTALVRNLRWQFNGKE